MSSSKVRQLRCDFCAAHAETEISDAYYVPYPEGWSQVDINAGQSAEVNRFDLCPAHSKTVTMGQLWEKIEAKRGSQLVRWHPLRTKPGR